jgi:hypothetical protein
MSHTPGRDHRKKSEPAKKKRFRSRAKKKKNKVLEDYNDAITAWNEMSEEAKKLRPELDPELKRP